MNKKTLVIIAAVILVVVLAICGIKALGKGNSNDNNIEGTLEDIMEKLYSGIPEDELPHLGNIEVSQDNIEYYLGTSDISYSEALASEPLMSSIAHSVVLVRLNDSKDAETVKEKISNNINPAKWICVEVEKQNVKVASKGNLVVLIMDNEIADKILENFNNL